MRTRSWARGKKRKIGFQFRWHVKGRNRERQQLRLRVVPRAVRQERRRMPGQGPRDVHLRRQLQMRRQLRLRVVSGDVRQDRRGVPGQGPRDVYLRSKLQMRRQLRLHVVPRQRSEGPCV